MVDLRKEVRSCHPHSGRNENLQRLARRRTDGHTEGQDLPLWPVAKAPRIRLTGSMVRPVRSCPQGSGRPSRRIFLGADTAAFSRTPER